MSYKIVKGKEGEVPKNLPSVFYGKPAITVSNWRKHDLRN